MAMRQVPTHKLMTQERNPTNNAAHCGGELQWGGGPHDELSFLFGDIARDPENRWWLPAQTFTSAPTYRRPWEYKVDFMGPRVAYRNGFAHESFDEFKMPMIAAINGIPTSLQNWRYHANGANMRPFRILPT